MELKTKEFKEVCSTILLAVDGSNEFSTNLELVANSNLLRLNVTNKEYYASVSFILSEPTTFRAVVSAPLFLNLIAGLSTETFTLDGNTNTVVITAGKSEYKLAQIYENNDLLVLPTIAVNNPTVEMPIARDILNSILKVNTKELAKLKANDATELQKLYYITEEGCFTFTTGACLNRFSLNTPVKLLLNTRIVKLFKLFKTDVQFIYGKDANPVTGQIQTKVTFKTDDVYLAAIIPDDNYLLETINRTCQATKNYIGIDYAHKLVLSVKELTGAVNRLLTFNKYSLSSASQSVAVTFAIANGELTLKDKLGNSEYVTINNEGSFTTGNYDMDLNITDLKLILDTCTEDCITLNCGNQKSVIVSHGSISHLLPERER